MLNYGPRFGVYVRLLFFFVSLLGALALRQVEKITQVNMPHSTHGFSRLCGIPTAHTVTYHSVSAAAFGNSTKRRKLNALLIQFAAPIWWIFQEGTLNIPGGFGLI